MSKKGFLKLVKVGALLACLLPVWVFGIEFLYVVRAEDGLARPPLDLHGGYGNDETHEIFVPVLLYQYIKESLPNLDGMILIPAGEFQMGCHPDHNDGSPCYFWQLPLHTVYLDAYYIDQHEVTNALYAQCVTAGRCAEPQSYSYGDPAKGEHPVTGVSWIGAYDYCRWVEKRLPTEAEWEKAARGPTLRAYPWGDGEPNCTLANFGTWAFKPPGSPGCVGDTIEVGSYPAGASSYGVLDMAGNVWEWVNDWYSPDYYSQSPPSNPTGPELAPGESGPKTVRGGAWWGFQSELGVAYRMFRSQFSYDGETGFRCAASQNDDPFFISESIGYPSTRTTSTVSLSQ
jgi:formylglycine-generating enzyme required for sulfatase activity